MPNLASLPVGYFYTRRWGGGLDLTSSLEAKFGARSSQVYEKRGKTWEVLSPKDAKVGKKNPNFEVKSEIHRAQFGVCAPIFLEAKFQRHILGPSPRPPNMEVPLGPPHKELL